MNNELNAASSDAPNAAGEREDEFISNLLKRQDEVLEELDELNIRIENAILEIGKSRQESNAATDQADEEVIEQSIRKAA